MNIQTKAGFRKEFLAYLRTHKLLIVALVIIGLAIFNPLMITGLGVFIDSMSDVYDDLGMDVSGMTEMLGTATSTGVTSSVEGITGIGVIVVLLLLNSAAGGEQKKRSVIIPKSAGLRGVAYILPKFIIYPVSVFIFSVIAVFVSWGMSALLFDINDVTLGGVMISGILSGICMMFYVCFHLALGTATGRAGMSSAVCITASVLLPTIFSLISPDYMYNPFTLNVLAYIAVLSDTLTSTELTDIAVTSAVACIIMLITYLIALFAQNARRIDNSGSDIDL